MSAHTDDGGEEYAFAKPSLSHIIITLLLERGIRGGYDIRG